MCRKLAEYCANDRDHVGAIRLYKEALSYEPESAPSLLALARLYLQVRFKIPYRIYYNLINFLP